METKKEVVFDSFLAGLIFVLVLLLLALNSCKHQPDIVPKKNTDETGNGESSITCDPDSVYFENQVLPLLISNCAQSNCHNAASHEEGVILDNYTNIMNTGEVSPGNPGNSELYEVITDTDPDKRMPPAGSLSQDKISIIYRWIAQGAKNNRCSDLCDTTNVTYTGTIFPMIQSYCTGCHSGSNPSGSISLVDHATISAAAQSGKLLSSINHDAGVTPMPEGGNKLSQCKIDAVRIWIQNGMPN